MPNTTEKARPLALSLAVLGAIARLLPHPPNFTLVGALSLYSGARLRSWQAYLVPILVLALTDPMMGMIFGHKPFTALTPFVYLSFLISVWIGRHLRPRERVWRIGGAALLGSLQFFVITNFAQWAIGHTYALTLTGLTECYLLAIPFFGWTVAGDLGYSAMLFGLHAWLSRRYFPQERVGVEPALR